jgi:large subunit ribosomal protein L25
MENVELRSQSRTGIGKQAKRLRAEGWIPAVVYGANLASKPIQLEERSFQKTLQQAGSTSLIDLFVDDEPKPYVVLPREIQRDILTGRLQHVDFYQVQLDKKIRTMPFIEIVGESPVVSSGRGILVHILNQVEVECLPTDLIHSIQVDVSRLQTLADTITIADLPVPEGVTIMADPADAVVSVVAPRVERVAEEEEIEAEELPPEAVVEVFEAEEEAEAEA